mgnify:CR=1 FL=1
MKQQNINIDISTVPNVECEECKHTCFVPTFFIKHVHSLMSPTGKDMILPLQVFKCAKCEHINELFLKGLTN